MKLQRLQYFILRPTGDLERSIFVSENDVAFRIPHVYEYINKYEGNGQKSSKISKFQCTRNSSRKSHTQEMQEVSICLRSAYDFQVSKCRFGWVE
jgi:hypothetical protein